ncbi:MAG: hypothetical protein HFE04_02620 [Bacilli bacterium]|nr:hypothetical protein [Bacilli bacterium]
MSYLEYSHALEISKMKEQSRILYTSYYIYCMDETKYITIEKIIKLLNSIGSYISNKSRVNTNIRKSKYYKQIQNDKYFLTPLALRKLSKEVPYITIQYK